MFVTGDAAVPRKMACFGSSGTCVQVAYDVMYQAGGASSLVAYIADDDPRTEQTDGTPIVGLETVAAEGDVAVFVPIHDPAGRRSVFARLERAGLPILGVGGLRHLTHPTARLGEGVIVQSTARIGPEVVVGRGTVIAGELVAHDVTIGSFTTIAARAAVLGHVEIGDDVFIGAGAIVKNGTSRRSLVIGDGAVIGMGAVVDRNVGPGEVVVGPRAMSVAEWQAVRVAARRRGSATP